MHVLFCVALTRPCLTLLQVWRSGCAQVSSWVQLPVNAAERVCKLDASGQPGSTPKRLLASRQLGCKAWRSFGALPERVNNMSGQTCEAWWSLFLDANSDSRRMCADCGQAKYLGGWLEMISFLQQTVLADSDLVGGRWRHHFSLRCNFSWLDGQSNAISWVDGQSILCGRNTHGVVQDFCHTVWHWQCTKLEMTASEWDKNQPMMSSCRSCHERTRESSWLDASTVGRQGRGTCNTGETERLQKGLVEKKGREHSTTQRSSGKEEKEKKEKHNKKRNNKEERKGEEVHNYLRFGRQCELLAWSDY